MAEMLPSAGCAAVALYTRMPDTPLVVFADADSYRRMRQTLDQAGYATATCAIDSLVDMAGLRRPMVVVLDAQQLVGPAAAVLDTLKVVGSAPIPVILTTKIKPEKLPIATRGLQVFSRPVDKETLLRAINAVDFAADGAQPAA
jgi:CheY-like chemotaxis protein